MSKEFIDRKIRLNAINLGDTTKGLTEDFNRSTSLKGNLKEVEEMISKIFLKNSNGYAASPKDMGYPMADIGSDVCSYMSGELIYIDYGLTSSWTSGALLSAQNKTIEELSGKANH